MFAVVGLGLLLVSAIVGLAAIILLRERERLRLEMLEALRERTSLAHMAVFELRQHLTSLSGLIDHRGRGRESRTEDLRRTLGAVNEALVDVLEVFDVGTGALVIKREPVELRGLAYALIRAAAKRAADAGRPVLLEAGHLPELWVEADPVRIRQCLSTLIDAAVQQTAYGRVRVSLRTERLEGEEQRVTFLVKDTGAGMAQEEARALFAPARYADHQAFSTRPPAMLQLNLARQIARAMGGELSAHSRPGCGTSFFLTISAASCPPVGTDETARVPDASAVDEAARFEGLSVLLVDDNPINLFVLEELVLPMGFKRVVSVEGGQAAIDRTRREAFDLVLLDLVMPEVDGWKTAEAIRSEGPSKGAAIIAVSADHRCGHDPRLGDLGIGAFVPKPLDHARLFAALAKVLRGPTLVRDAEGLAGHR